MSYFFLFILGSVLASTAMCWVDRGGDQPWLRGRSYCLSCQSPLRSWDLIPVISGLFLRARCRYCKTYYGWHYPLAELCAGFAFAALGSRPLLLVTATVLLVLSLEDLRTLSAHVYWVWPLIAASWLMGELAINWLLILLVSALFVWLAYCRRSLGSGDGPVLMLLASQLSPTAWAGALLVASVTAIIYYYWKAGKQAIPFIPFLTLGWLIMQIIH